MIEVNLLHPKEGFEYNEAVRFTQALRVSWLHLTVRKGEPGGIYSSVAKVKGNPVRVVNG